MYLCLITLGGCSAPPAGQPQICVITAERDLLWQSCDRVIRRFGFEPYLVQPGRGLIITEPQTSAQWFECWRKDTPTAYALAESSLHTIRRHVRLEVSYDAAAEASINCAVAIERLHRTEDTGALRYATNIFSQGSSSAIPRRQQDLTEVEWISLGYDMELQQKILDEICSYYHRSVPAL
ncbi:MAG: hypothetical protein JW709_10455 [Sedimentisphaerales bacterium]|nr:hypothetical protein [Sedimentisphaerales bacterium]